MSTLIDYIKWNQDKSFQELPLNELDIVAINEIGYLSFDVLVTDVIKEDSLIDLSSILVDEGQDSQNTVYNFLISKERVALFRSLRDSKRFKELSLSHYVNDIDPESEKQFAAMVFKIPSICHTQIVFRGTDDSLIGWKEDFKLTYMNAIASQKSALLYLSSYLEKNPDEQVILTGHSKGGHLALYAFTSLLNSLQKRVKKAYLLDSPGLSKEMLETEAYKRVRERLILIRPQESIVGVMLYSDVKPKIVKSNSFGLLQHKTSNWQVRLDGEFISVDKPSSLSLSLELTFKAWTNQLSKEDLKLVCDSFFDALFLSGITSLNAFTLDEHVFHTFFKVLASLRSIDHFKKAIMVKSIRQLIHNYTGYRRRGVNLKVQEKVTEILHRSSRKKHSKKS
ncbi:Mbeg1-like protein [Streptococcus didelphis]|uniref:Mbeg1-like protein n=1 Tax=Streptococcus didelphis TaxID=102886 RepID=UPI0003696185|nr:Mbeg1-like protein [Streptococcus didelphis]